MILRLLLAFSVFSLGLAEVSLDQLKWQPEMIEKKTILKNHKDLIDNDPLFTDIPQLVYVEDVNPRSAANAQIHAKRINYLSNTWFQVAPQYDMQGKLVNVDINGKENIDRQFVIEMRKLNPNIKMVPRFLFTDWPPSSMKELVERKPLALRCVQTIANFIREYGFDGAVIDIFAAFTGAMDSAHSTESIETLVQIGSILRRNEQVAILSMPAPANAVPVNNEGKDNLLLPQENDLKLLDGYDYIQFWTYSDALHLRDRTNVHDEFTKYFDYSPKLLILVFPITFLIICVRRIMCNKTAGFDINRLPALAKKHCYDRLSHTDFLKMSLTSFHRMNVMSHYSIHRNFILKINSGISWIQNERVGKKSQNFITLSFSRIEDYPDNMKLMGFSINYKDLSYMYRGHKRHVWIVDFDRTMFWDLMVSHLDFLFRRTDGDVIHRLHNEF